MGGGLSHSISGSVCRGHPGFTVPPVTMCAYTDFLKLSPLEEFLKVYLTAAVLHLPVYLDSLSGHLRKTADHSPHRARPPPQRAGACQALPPGGT